MKSYGQFCPVAKAAALFCERWTPLIIRDLACGATRYSELRRGVPLMSTALLSKRLRQLEAEGIIERRQVRGKGASYHLTPAGQEFAPVVALLGVWGQRWSRRQLAEDEVDLGLLIWALERNVRADAFAMSQTVVELRFSDLPASKNHWWFLNRDGKCELCLEDPGFEIDLYLTASLRDMIHIVRGDLALSRAIASGRLEVLGSSRLRRALAAWLNLGAVTKIKSQRSDARAA